MPQAASPYLLLGVLTALGVAITSSEAQASTHRHRAHRHHKIAAPTPPVASVRAPIREWPEWGNDKVGDCTFAAAADYLLITRGSVNDTDPQIVTEFYEAGGHEAGGMQVEQMARFWHTHGIAGIHATVTERPASQLEYLVHLKGAVIANVVLGGGEKFYVPPFKRADGVTTVEEGTREMFGSFQHAWVVAGYNSTGPEVVTWGRTMQLTWAQWKNADPTIYEVN